MKSKMKFLCTFSDRLLETPGIRAKFFDNDLNIQSGIYHPHFPHLLLSVTQLNSEGHSVSFHPQGAEVELQGGRVKTCWLVNNLPTITVHFAKGNSASCCAACSSEFQKVDSDTHCCYLSKQLKDQLLHERFGHFWVPGLKVDCPACAASKKFGIGHKKERPPEYLPTWFLDQVDWDFKGPLPLSFFNRRWILSAMCQASGWVENFPVFSKWDC